GEGAFIFPCGHVPLVRGECGLELGGVAGSCLQDSRLELRLLAAGPAKELVEEAGFPPCPFSQHRFLMMVCAFRPQRGRGIQDLLPVPLRSLRLVNGQEHLELVLMAFHLQAGPFESREFRGFAGALLKFTLTPLFLAHSASVRDLVTANGAGPAHGRLMRLLPRAASLQSGFACHGAWAFGNGPASSGRRPDPEPVTQCASYIRGGRGS